jgi:YggT family protein
MSALHALSVLALTKATIGRFVEDFIYVYIALIFAYVISGWLRLPYSSGLSRVQRFLYEVCDPYLRLFRRVIPPIGPLDVSPMVAILVLIVIARVVASVL